MAWETEQKLVRGTAQRLPAAVIADSAGGNAVYVRFDKAQYDPKTGKELHGKLYETMEEAIQEMGAKIPERVMRDGEEIPVTIPVLLNKWVEE